MTQKHEFIPRTDISTGNPVCAFEVGPNLYCGEGESDDVHDVAQADYDFAISLEAQKFIAAGWSVSKASLYDEEGIEGWMWLSPQGTEYGVTGHWDEPAPPPDVDLAPDEAELLPCPFCGNAAITFESDAHRNIVSCRLGHAPMRTVEGWNTRVSPSRDETGLNLLRQLVSGQNALRDFDVFQCNVTEHDLDCQCFWEQCEAWAKADAAGETVPAPSREAFDALIEKQREEIERLRKMLKFWLPRGRPMAYSDAWNEARAALADEPKEVVEKK